MSRKTHVDRICALLPMLVSAMCSAQNAPSPVPTRPGDTPAGYFQPASRPPASVMAEARMREMETLAKLTADGQALFDADAAKQTGYDYVHAAQSLAFRGEFRLAVREASKALFLGQREGNDDLLAWAKRDLAVAYSYAGNLDRAQQYAQEALRHDVRAWSRGTVHSAAYKVLGDVALRRGDTKAAIDWYEKAYGMNDGAIRFLARAGLANAYVAAGDHAKATSALKAAESYLDVLSANARANGEMALARIRGNLALKQGKAAEARDLFTAMVQQNGDANQRLQRYWALEGLARAQTAAGDAVAALVSYNQAIATSEQVRARFRSEEIATAIFGEMRQAFDGAVQLSMEAGQPEAAWQASERGRSRALLDLVRNRVQLTSGSDVFIDPTGTTVSLAELQAVLKPGEALVEYHVLPARTYAWVIRAGKFSAVTIEVTRDELARRVEAFRDAVSQQNPRADDGAAQLYDLLVRPLGLGDNDALLIVPHDALHYLPFQALRDGDRYLIAKSAVSYAPSASTLAAVLGTLSAKKGKLLALGNPDLGRPDHALPGAQREIDQIRQLFPEQESYFGKDATKQRLLAAAPTANLVHVAAHAQVDALDPLYSRILLASDGKESGTLEAREIYRLDLRKSGLVTLSACESGLGKVSSGDEIWGFTRSFLSAGVPALLVSLWPVADESTELLMTRFYQSLSKGKDARESLRLAQIEVAREPRFAHPFYWAPFDLVGDWR